MAKVQIGKLRKMLRADPDMETQLAYALGVIICNYHAFGEYASFMVIGADSSSPEIVIKKSDLIKFAHEVLAKLGAEYGSK